MARRRYLIAYDIASPYRLRKVITHMESYGERLQYSVFLCDLSGAERARWEIEIRGLINLAEDSVVSIDLGSVGASAPIATLGVPRRLPASGPTVV
jgi:CRISPR-associated protein Cas2